MGTEIQDRVRSYAIRAAIPRYLRVASACLIVLVVLAIGLGFYWGSRTTTFRMQGFPTSLSKDVVASVQGYERTEFEGDQRKYYVKAEHATTYADQHQELVNPYFEIFSQDGQSDKITAKKAVYVPEENKNFTAYLAGNVNVVTRDSLHVATEQVTYKKANDTAEAEEEVHFDRANLGGRSVGAKVKIADKKLDLLKDVEIKEFAGPDRVGDPISTLNSGSGTYDQKIERVSLVGQVNMNRADGTGRNTSLTSDNANIDLVSENGKRSIKNASATGNVTVTSLDKRGKTEINGGRGDFDAIGDIFSISDNVLVTVSNSGEPLNANGGHLVFERSNGNLLLENGAELTQGNVTIKGDRVRAELAADNKLSASQVDGNAYIRRVEDDKTLELFAANMNAGFGSDQKVTSARGTGSVKAILTPTNNREYARAVMESPGQVVLAFRTGGVVEKMSSSDGRATILLDGSGRAGASNKRVTADNVTTSFSPDGKNIVSASAIGNAELLVVPTDAPAPGLYNTQVNAPRFDCDFYPTGNAARFCNGGVGTKTVRVPLKPDSAHGTQVLTATKVSASFLQTAGDIETLSASGNAKFSEGDRHGNAENITYTSADRTIRLRDSQPTVWDSRARAKADAIDWNTAEQKSFLSGNVSTTYYSQQSSGGATPFGTTKEPVFLTAENAEIDHQNEVAVYTGNARGWQGSNYIRCDKFTIRQAAGQFDAEGHVQSLLYDAKKRMGGRNSTVPVSAASDAMTYLRDGRRLKYTGNVDIRQGTDRITGGQADILLNDKNEATRSEIRNNVVITQPGRRATADLATYDASSEVVVLKGDPATVADATRGNSRAGTISIDLSDNTFSSEGRSDHNSSGRTRSVYKVKEN